MRSVADSALQSLQPLLDARDRLPTALCVHLRLPLQTGLADLDTALASIDDMVGTHGREVFCVFAAHREPRRDVMTTGLLIEGGAHG